MNSVPTMVNGFDPADTARLTPSSRRVIERRRRSLGPGYRLFYQQPVELVRGEGAFLYDAEGERYVDAYNNVPGVGHCHPHVVEAVHRQMSTLNTNTRYVHGAVVDYAERLLSLFPVELDRVTFTCSGSEANDLAMRVARFFTGHEGVIVTENAYHGLTTEVAAFSPSLGTGSALGPHVRTIRPPDRHLTDGEVNEYVRTQVRCAIGDLRRHGFELGAFFADSAFSSDGIFTHPVGFLRPIVEEVHAAGGLYVADEVQAGFGRLGESWWGFERHGVVPDIVTLGKSMGNGIPISATVFRSPIIAEFDRTVRYFNTFGGSTVPIAAANAVLDVLVDEDLISRAHRVGSELRDQIAGLLRPYGQVADIRGAGYFIGVEFDAEESDLATLMVNDLRRRRVLISASGPHGSVLKIRPPLAFGDQHAQILLQALERSAEEVLGGEGP